MPGRHRRNSRLGTVIALGLALGRDQDGLTNKQIRARLFISERMAGANA